jgi:phosphomannomutase
MSNNTKIRFGTDGWRAIIAGDFTVSNLARVAEATAAWLLQGNSKPSVVIGYDTRFGGTLFAETTAKVLAARGIRCYLSKGFSSTPMVSLGTVQKKADLGIVITASHNPPTYNGYKLKGPYGGPLLPEKIEEIEKLIPEHPSISPSAYELSVFEERGLVQYIDLENMYCDHVRENFDLDAINRSGIGVAYDAMFGAGQNVIRRLLPNARLLHCDSNPGFNGRAPEPIDKNLNELEHLVRSSDDIACGIATDGDADRIGIFDHLGRFIDSHHVILLLIRYLCEVKQMKGKVVTAFSVSPKVGKMCRHFGLDHQVTRVGFKHIAGIMVSEDVLLGGEESGGIAIKGHIPERDGVWIGLTLLEYMVKSGRSLSELIDEVYGIVGKFAFERVDLHLQEDVKNRIVENCAKNVYRNFGDFKIQRTESIDGYKYFFNDEEWFMVRASGTEPVLRNYAQSESPEKASLILKAAEQTFLGPDQQHLEA